MRSYLVRDYMTPSPHTVGMTQPLSVAHDLMRRHGIRHLPVLDGGKLAGIVSLPDLHFIETLPDVRDTEVTVEEAMTQDPCWVEPNTPIALVAPDMMRTRHGSTIVVEGTKVVGMFTTVDALRALCDALAEVKDLREQRHDAAQASATPTRRKRNGRGASRAGM